MVNPSGITTCKGCGVRIYFSGSNFVPIEAKTDNPHKCIVHSSVFRQTATRMYGNSAGARQTEKAISNELDRIASKSIVGNARLEKRVEVLEKKVKELEDQLLEKHNEIGMLKRQVDRLNTLVESKD